jgi:hypothetical protein
MGLHKLRQRSAAVAPAWPPQTWPLQTWLPPQTWPQPNGAVTGRGVGAVARVRSASDASTRSRRTVAKAFAAADPVPQLSPRRSGNSGMCASLGLRTAWAPGSEPASLRRGASGRSCVGRLSLRVGAKPLLRSFGTSSTRSAKAGFEHARGRTGRSSCLGCHFGRRRPDFEHPEQPQGTAKPSLRCTAPAASPTATGVIVSRETYPNSGALRRNSRPPCG